MAIYYLWSGATGSATGADWTNAYTAWSSVPALTNGDIVKVHTGTTSPHVESQAADFQFYGPASAPPAYVIGVDKDNSDAFIESSVDNFTTTGTTADIRFDGAIVVQGIHFKSGDQIYSVAGDGNETPLICENCRFDNQTDAWVITSTSTVVANNCSFVFGTGGYFSSASTLTLNGCTLSGSKSYIFQQTSGTATLLGCDLTGVTSTNLLWQQTASTMFLIGCDLPSWTDYTSVYADLRIYGSAATANQWNTERRGGQSGSLTAVEGVYRTGGATYDGTNEYSLKLSANTYNDFYYPVVTDWQTGYIAADSGTQTTWTVYIANSSADINDDDCWLEVEYFGDSGSTLKTIATTRPATVLVTPSAIPDDAVSTWTGITEFAQKLSVTATVALAGMYRWRVSSTFTTTDVYVCPKADVVQA